SSAASAHGSPTSRATATNTATSTTAAAAAAATISGARRIASRRRLLAAERPPDRVEPVPRTPRGDPPQRLPHDARTHLARPTLALGERDGHLGDAQAATVRPPGEVDLEAVALRG